MTTGYAIAVFAVLLVGAYFDDDWTGRKKPREELLGLVRSPNWRLHPKAMAELRRRGEDMAVDLPRFLPLLAHESRNERVAAEMLVKKFAPLLGRFATGRELRTESE